MLSSNSLTRSVARIASRTNSTAAPHRLSKTSLRQSKITSVAVSRLLHSVQCVWKLYNFAIQRETLAFLFSPPLSPRWVSPRNRPIFKDYTRSLSRSIATQLASKASATVRPPGAALAAFARAYTSETTPTPPKPLSTGQKVGAFRDCAVVDF